MLYKRKNLELVLDLVLGLLKIFHGYFLVDFAVSV